MFWRSAYFSRSTTCCGHMLLQVDAVSRQRCQSSRTLSSQIRASLQPKVQAEQYSTKTQIQDFWNKAHSPMSDCFPSPTLRKNRADQSKVCFRWDRCLFITQTTWPAITVIILAVFCWILGHAKEQTSHDSGGGHEDKYYCFISMDFWTVAWTQTHGFG